MARVLLSESNMETEVKNTRPCCPQCHNNDDVWLGEHEGFICQHCGAVFLQGTTKGEAPYTFKELEETLRATMNTLRQMDANSGVSSEYAKGYGAAVKVMLGKVEGWLPPGFEVKK